MTTTFSYHDIAWYRIFLLLLLIISPNYLVMQMQIGGSVNDLIGIGTAVDFVIVLPVTLYFWGFRKRLPWVILGTFILSGLVLANLIIPKEANGYLTYFNGSVILLETGFIILEIVLFIVFVKKLPLLLSNYKLEKNTHYHFLLSFSAAIQNTFTFKSKRLNKFKFVLHVLATDIAVIYYSLFSWRKKQYSFQKGHIQTFTYHKNSEYLGVFFLLVHAMTIEVIAVHFLVSYYFNPIAAWIITIFDIQLLLFIISDYQAIRLSPVILDLKGISFQKGIRQYGFIPWDKIEGMNKNDSSLKEVNKDRESITLGLHGLEQKSMPYVIKLKEAIEIRQFFGIKKTIRSIYLDIDDFQKFNEAVNDYLSNTQHLK